MKRLVTILALGVAISAPAFAQTTRHSVRTDTRVQGTTQSPDGRLHSPNPAYDVYNSAGQYVGSDPDPFIRSVLPFEHNND